MRLPATSGCTSEQVSAGLLGYTQASWDYMPNVKQPAAENKYFLALTHKERQYAVALGYSEKTWDNLSGDEKQPATDGKTWAELSICGKTLLRSLFVHNGLI